LEDRDRLLARALRQVEAPIGFSLGHGER
jgi:hypothetical protein